MNKQDSLKSLAPCCCGNGLQTNRGEQKLFLNKTRKPKFEKTKNELTFVDVTENKAHSSAGLSEGAEVGSPAAKAKPHFLFVEMFQIFE